MKIAIWGVAPVAAVPLTIMTLREFVTTLLHDAGSGRLSDLATAGAACAALFLLNAALLASSPAAGVARLSIAHAVLAPLAAWCCFAGAVDPVALVVALPLVAGVVMTLGAPSCPLRRVAGSR